MRLLESERLRPCELTYADRNAVLSVLMNEQIMSAMHLPRSVDFAGK